MVVSSFLVVFSLILFCSVFSSGAPQAIEYSHICSIDGDVTTWQPDLQPAAFETTSFSGINDANSFSGQKFPPYAQGDSVPTAMLARRMKGGVEETVKILFFPLMDQFSMMQVVNSSDILWLDQSDSTRIRVEQIGVNSPTRRRALDGCSHRVPFWTLIVTVESGVPTKHEWDDDCSLCRVCTPVGTCPEEPSLCVDENCGNFPTACTSRGGATDCDLKVYIGWTGTDKNGVYLTSAGKRLSQFRMWSLSAAYNAASQFSSQNLPVPPTEISQCATGTPNAAGECVG